jgi:hypothetical protein
MRDARYVRLISWTLQSGSEQFIYKQEPNPRGPGPRNWQKGTDKAATETNGWKHKSCQKYTQTVKTRKILTME